MKKYILKEEHSKSLYARAAQETECPKCGAKAGYYCSTPKGRTVWPPHLDRMDAWRNEAPLPPLMIELPPFPSIYRSADK